ncbi:unnamed protein product [Parascedosporium putredinis]|uniref:Major facilitator superfamily (MFS) profile domain-containing protein n=1 Tax=Parascedosporium putredinis TaxID=1442378 RepID=A0A9P1H964_9PEZI|nr:unnamed protein product [Parascedosporium putredinis]CAI8001511.1 unnamed protein product [Parascedosporium putredinis]
MWPNNTHLQVSQGYLELLYTRGLLFSTLDAGIVATSMTAIGDEMKSYDNITWIILAYLLTYMGFAVVISRLSDIFGRKDVLLGSWLLFLTFSHGCATSTRMTELIVCRALQGVGVPDSMLCRKSHFSN